MIKENFTLTVIINQYNKLGDILFCLSYAQEIAKMGYEVIIPVRKEIEEIAPYCPGVNIVPMERIQIDYNSQEIIQNDEMMIIPIRFANTIVAEGQRVKCMISKHQLFCDLFNMGRPLKDWWKARIILDEGKANRLFYELDLNPDEDYTFINETYAGYGDGTKMRYVLPQGHHKRLVYLKKIPGYTLFDWYKVIAKASSIHTVVTSVVFMIEMLSLWHPDVHLYRRPHEPNMDNINFLLRMPWKYHD